MLTRLAVWMTLAVVIACPGWAADVCRAEVNSTKLLIRPDALGIASDNPGLTERATSWPGRGLARLAGKAPACDSTTLIAFLAAEVPPEEIAGYCLSPDDKLGFLLVPGPRNFRGRCTRTTCDRINAATGAALDVAGTTTDIVSGRDTAAGETRTDAVLHASGAAILSGSAASLISSLGAGAGSALGAALAAPALAGAAAVSVVAVGGAVYLCR